MSPTLAGQGRVTLRWPFPIDCADKLWRWLNSPRDPNFDDFGPVHQFDFVRVLRARIESEITWSIRIDGEVAGFLGFSPMNPVCGQFHGMVIHPQFRRAGIGSEALSLAVSELKTRGYEKLICWTYADNVPVNRLFQRCGFRQEGYLRGATKRHGQPLDIRILCLPGVDAESEVI